MSEFQKIMQTISMQIRMQRFGSHWNWTVETITEYTDTLYFYKFIEWHQIYIVDVTVIKNCCFIHTKNAEFVVWN